MAFTKRILAFLLIIVNIFVLISCAYQEYCEGETTLTGNLAPGALHSEQGSNTTNEEDKEPPTIDEQNKRDEVLSLLDNDYESRSHTSYANINGKTVDLYTFYRANNESQNNPNFSQILMVKQCIDYKIKHPEEDVKITICSFHFSVYLSACLDPTKEEYGNLKNLYGASDYDEESGYYRLSYLLVEAAKHGIDVTVIGQLNASSVLVSEGVKKGDYSFWQYFTGRLNWGTYIPGKNVGDFLTVRKTEWTSYGDKAAADMMHLKSCTVSNFIDNNGGEHGTAVWLGSTNIDGVDYLGRNGNNGMQTGVVITGHDAIYNVICNYVELMTHYCGQEEINIFRDIVIDRNTEQIALIEAGRGNEIPSDEQIVYLGSENDKVFEFFFAPFGGDTNVWDTSTNPFCKYLNKLLPTNSDSEYIEILWNNVKFVQNFDLGDTMMEVIAKAFKESGRKDNVLRLRLPGIDKNLFSSLKAGNNIGHKYIGGAGSYHIKDLQLSYSEGGERYYVTLYNTLNMHEGSMCYQTNTVFIVKETAETGNRFYIDYAILTSPDIEFESKRVKGE